MKRVLLITTLTGILFLTFAIVFTACKKDEANKIPVVSSVMVSPASIAAGGTVNVSVTATDGDNDALTYAYTPNGGFVSGTGPSVTWTAPSTAGGYSISVMVSDGQGGTASGSGGLTVTGGGGGGDNGTVAGTAFFIAGVSGDLSNAKVSIYTTLDNWNFNQPIKFVGCSGSGASVSFSMTSVLPGTYYLDVWKDIDNSGTWTSGDFVGWYGSGGLGSPALTEFMIVAGETKTFNVQMYIIAKGAKLPK